MEPEVQNQLQISPDPQPVQVAQLELGKPNQAPVYPVDPDVAASRGIKARMGLPLDMPYGELVQKISDGYEDDVRKRASNQLDIEQATHLNNTIIQAAKDKKGPLSLPEIETLKSMFKIKQSNPNSVIEEGYAKVFMDGLRHYARQHPDSDMAQAFQADPEQAEKVLTVGEQLRTRNELIETALEDMEAARKAQSWVGWGLDQGKLMFPGYNEIKLRGVQGDTSYFHGLLGTNLDEQAANAYLKPIDEFKQWIQAVKEKFMRDNPTAGIMFLSAMKGQSNTERLLNNLFSAIDIGTVGATAKGAFSLTRSLTGAVKSAVRTDYVPSASSVEAAVGRNRDAGLTKAAENLTRENNGIAAADPVRDASSQMHSAFQATGANVGEGVARNRNLSQEFVNRLQEDINRNREALATSVDQALKVQTTPELFANRDKLDKLSQYYREQFPGISNGVMDTMFPPAGKLGERFADTYITRDGVNLFQNERAAEAVNKKFLKGQGEVRQVGGGYVLVNRQPFDESTKLVQSLLIDTGTKTPVNNSIMDVITNGRWSRYVKGPEETLSGAQKMNRKLATVGPSNIFNLLKENSRAIYKLRGWPLPFTSRYGKWTQWKSVMNSALDQDRNLKFNNVGELTDLYMQKWQRLPDPQEVRAAFAYKTNKDFLDVMNQRRAFIELHRDGHQTWTVRLPNQLDPQGKSGMGQLEYTVNAKKITEFPKGDEALLVVSSDGNTYHGSARNFKGKLATDVIEQVKQGQLQLLQVSPADQRARVFSRFPGGKWSSPEKNSKVTVGDSRVKWVVTPNAEAKGLDWNSVKVGKIADSDFEHYLAQANMRFDKATNLWHYENDTTIMASNHRGEVTEYAKHLNAIREALKDSNEGKAKAAYRAGKLAQDYNEIKEWFESGKLNLNEPIHVVPRGETVRNVDRELASRYTKTPAGKTAKFKDSSRFVADEHDPFDMFSAKNTGTKENPLWNLVPVEHIDPILSMNRSLTKAVQGQWIDDYRAFSVMHWIQEAKPFMDKMINVDSNPWYYFHNPIWKKGIELDHKAEIESLITAQMHIKQFLGIQDNATTFLHSVAQKLADSFYEKGYNRLALAPTYMLPYLRDPFQFIRTMTFHMRLGMFNPARMVIHGMNYVNVLGVAGAKYAAPGTKATLLRWMSRINSSPEILDALDRYAGMLQIPGSSRWLPGQWREATEGLMRAGYEHAGREQAMWDASAYQDLVGTKLDAFLHAGTWFQATAEREVRTSAWYTAYREYRDKVAHGALTDHDWGRILDRADLLASNMTRASNSMIQKGVFSLPTQFLTYQLRVAEIFMGKRLTGVERARLFATYSTLFGVPGGLALTGAPAVDFINKWAEEGGYKRGDSETSWGYRYINDAVTNGLPALFTALITGGGDTSKGNWLNYAERYAGGGIEPIRQALRGDRPMWDIITGAAGTTMGNLFKSMGGLYEAVIDGISGTGDYKLKMDDFVDVWKEVTSFQHGVQLYYALNMGKMFSKNEVYLGDTSKSNAVYQYLMGLSPQGLPTTYTKEWIMRDEKEAQSLAERNALKEFQRTIRAQHNGNVDQATDYMRRAFVWLKTSNYPREDYGKFFAIAAKGYESLIDKVAHEFGTKHVPENKKLQRMEQLNREVRQR